jgi:hypothetical protein
MKGVPKESIDYIAQEKGYTQMEVYEDHLLKSDRGVDFPLGLPDRPRFIGSKNWETNISTDPKEALRNVRNICGKYTVTQYYKQLDDLIVKRVTYDLFE